MKTFIALAVLVAAAHASVVPAPALVRTPSFDSAIIKSDRLGGNFAYSTVEGHAYAAVSPVVQRITEPVGVSYTPHQVNLGHISTPVAVSQPIYAQQSILSQPILSQSILSQPILSQSILSQPILSQQHFISAAPGLFSHPSLIGQAPVISGVASTPIATPVAAPAAPSDVTGTVVDADTVAVESA